MMKFFAYFRQLFAIDRAYEVLAEVIYDAIKRIYIPELHRQAEMVEGLDEREDINELIEEYKKYGNPRTPEGREFAEVAARVVGSTAVKYRNTGVVEEEVIQQIAGDFYANPRMVKTLQDFDPADGPVKLRNYWSNILNFHSAYQFRNAENKILQRNKKTPTDEGEERDPLNNISAPEKQDIGEMMVRMKKFVPQNVERYMPSGRKYTAEVAVEIFNIWSEEFDKSDDLDKGPEEVFPKWERMRKKQGDSYGKSLFNEGLTTLKRTLKAFFVEEKRNQKVYGRTAAERVAKAEFRIRFAKWMLGE